MRLVDDVVELLDHLVGELPDEVVDRVRIRVQRHARRDYCAEPASQFLK